MYTSLFIIHGLTITIGYVNQYLGYGWYESSWIVLSCFYPNTINMLILLWVHLSHLTLSIFITSPNGKSLLVKNLCLPQIKPICDSYNARHLKQVSSFYRNYVWLEKKISVNTIDKLYVSRQLAPRRKVINEDEIVKILEKYGFTIFHPERYTFLEQVAIFSRVKYLVGEHGSGLTNLLFMEKGTFILELHKDKTNELDRPAFLFWYMAEALGINYYHQLCETHGKEDYFDGDYIVDVDLFEKNLIKMLN
jgi:hypothetical protein